MSAPDVDDMAQLRNMLDLLAEAIEDARASMEAIEERTDEIAKARIKPWFDYFRRAVIRSARPAIEAEVRERVAREIEAQHCEVSAPLALVMACCARQRQDARIARGSDA